MMLVLDRVLQLKMSGRASGAGTESSFFLKYDDILIAFDLTGSFMAPYEKHEIVQFKLHHEWKNLKCH